MALVWKKLNGKREIVEVEERKAMIDINQFEMGTITDSLLYCIKDDKCRKEIGKDEIEHNLCLIARGYGIQATKKDYPKVFKMCTEAYEEVHKGEKVEGKKY